MKEGAPRIDTDAEFQRITDAPDMQYLKGFGKMGLEAAAAPDIETHEKFSDEQPFGMFVEVGEDKLQRMGANYWTSTPNRGDVVKDKG